MIAIVNTQDIINAMMDAERDNIQHMKKELKSQPDVIPVVVENVKKHFQAGIEQVKNCKTDEDVVNLIKLGFINFTVLQLDMNAIQGILQQNGIDLQELTQGITKPKQVPES